MESDNKMTYLMLGGMYAFFLFLCFVSVSVMGGIPPLSVDSFLEPFTGPQSMLALVLAALVPLHMAWYHMSFFPKSVSDPRNHLLLIVIPEVYAVAGFLIGIVYLDPWAAMPFIALGFANYAYAFTKIQGVRQTP